MNDLIKKYGYIIVSYGDDPEQDYIAANGKLYLSKELAETECQRLQKEYDIDSPNNPYEFKIGSLEVIE